MSEVKLPWYKHKLVWMLIAIPASAVFAGIYTIYLAVTTADGLVVDDYYKHGMAINKTLARDTQAEHLQLSADVEIDPESGYVKVVLDAGSLATPPEQIALSMHHATQQRHDNHVALYRGQGNQYVGSIGKDIRKGVWYVQLSDADAGDTGWRLSQRARIDEFTRLQLAPIPAVQPES